MARGVTAIRFRFETLGCKVNQFETQALETLLISRGHTAAALGSGCDAVIVNTCAVTAESTRKSRQAVRRLKKLEPDAVVAVCGCFSQVSPEEVGSLGVDLIAGSGDRTKFVDELEHTVSDRTPRLLIDDPKKRRVFEALPAGSAAGRTRAMLKIQDGCQNFCTYCIIPYARGPVRSMPPNLARIDAAQLGAAGYKEIVLTGIEISSYGTDLPDCPTLADVIRTVSMAAPDARVRLGSLEPTVITQAFCAGLKTLPNICDHFHLSLQSGCDETLRRMKRRYTTETFFKAISLLRDYFPDCAVTADLIVGFPGETDDAFLKTLAFIKKCDFSSMHVFPFSRRPGTPAADMTGQIEKDVKQERAHRAAQEAKEMTHAYAGSCMGKTLNVLFERETQGWSVGHAANYMQVSVRQTGLRGEIYPVRVIGEKERLLLGEIIKP